MSKTAIKLIAILIFAAAVLFLMAFKTAPTSGAAVTAFDETTDTYKAKCAMCHAPNASKFYNADMPEAEQVDAILKGKKGEKPPNMPGFETKGMTADQAKALAAYMKSLKTAN